MLLIACCLLADDPFAGLERNGVVSSISVRVERGDTLTEIVRRYYFGHVDDLDAVVRAVAERNGLGGGRTMQAGATLSLPYPFEGRPREFTASRDVNLEAVTPQFYGYAKKPESLWPLVYLANRGTVTAGGRRVKKGTRLTIPPVPLDAQARAAAVTDAYRSLLADFRKHLEGGQAEAAAEDRFLLLQGFFPMLERNVPGWTASRSAQEKRAVEGLWAAAQAERTASDLAAAVPALNAMEAHVTALEEAATKLEAARVWAVQAKEEAVVQRLEAVRNRLVAAVRKTFGEQIRSIGRALATPPEISEPTAQARQCRSEAFQTRFHLSRLESVPGLEQTAAELRRDLTVELMGVPAPPPQLPAMTERVRVKDPAGRRSMTVAHDAFARRWLPMAVAYARGLWTGFPEARNSWDRVITQEEVLKAIIIHESRGIHKDRGSVTANRNSTSSIDFGFCQINNAAHEGTRVRLAQMAETMGGDWTVDKLGSKEYLEVPKRLRSQPVTLVLTNPAHNVVAAVLVLSYSISRKYPRTASPEEQLVKSLSAYNHGAGNPDYAQPWLDFVKKVDPKTGEDGEVSAVDYGIGMKMYLGMDLDSAEVSWWTRRKKLSPQRMFYLYVDPYYRYAHFP